jgi:hypothetical protein
MSQKLTKKKAEEQRQRKLGAYVEVGHVKREARVKKRC